MARAGNFLEMYRKKKDIMTDQEKMWFKEALSRYDAAGEVHTDEGMSILQDMEARLRKI